MWTSTTKTGWALRYLGILGGAALLSLAAASAWLPGPVAVLVVIALGAVAGAVIYYFEPFGTDLRGLCLWGALLTAMIAGGLGAYYARQVSLTLWGEPVIATVATVSGDSYTLLHDGERIPGRLTSWPEGDETFGEHDRGSRGDTVIVLRDPLGLVGPALPAEFNHTGVPEALAVLSIPIGLLVVLCVQAGKEQVMLTEQGAGRARRRTPARRLIL